MIRLKLRRVHSYSALLVRQARMTPLPWRPHERRPHMWQKNMDHTPSHASITACETSHFSLKQTIWCIHITVILYLNLGLMSKSVSLKILGLKLVKLDCIKWTGWSLWLASCSNLKSVKFLFNKLIYIAVKQHLYFSISCVQ